MSESKFEGSIKWSVCILTLAVSVVLASCGSVGSAPAPPTYTIGGTVSGLSGTGLVLQANGGNNLQVSAGATNFAFTTSVASGGSYSVTVLSQPTSPSQTCVLSNGSGVVANANITSLQVTCSTNTYTIGGTLSGLSGTGLVLQDDGGNNLPVSAGATSFAFTTNIASGSNYSVTVFSQPTSPSQTCVLSNGSGAVTSANIASVQITCTINTYTIGGTLSGLSGTGLVLQANGGNNLPVSAGATSFAFTTNIASGSNYSVTVFSQPSSPSQTCVLTSGSGAVTSANISSLQVTCTTNTYTIGGTVVGLSGTGLVLQDNGGNNLPVTAGSTSFAFRTSIASGSNYSVTVASQPSSPSQICGLTSGSGTVTSANITSVQVTCINTYTIGGTVSGLLGAGLILQDNGGNNLQLNAGASSFAFTTNIASGSNYSVTVFSQPTGPSQTCVLSSGSGNVTSANITTVKLTCTTNTYTIGGTVSGLSGTGLVLQDNGSNSLAVSPGATSFAFSTNIASGNTYNVTVASQPSSPAQMCVLSNPGGAVTSANVTSVQVTCINTYTIGGTVVGLPGTGGGLVLQANNSNSFSVNRNGSFTFSTALLSGASYDVTILTQPSLPVQTCTVIGGSGKALTDVANIKVDCGHNQWTWMGGSNLFNQQGTYGTMGIPAPSNIPGARSLSANWADGNGNFWIFGGYGMDVGGNAGELNDLWEFSAGQWTWMGGSNFVNQNGNYGTQGVAASSNFPGARLNAFSWIDSTGNLWLFGGIGLDSTGTRNVLNDLWKYSAGKWTWMGGSNLGGQVGTFGTLGISSATNIPGARQGNATWVDKHGDLWLFGGSGYDSNGGQGHLNDLWKYSGGQWMWVSGSNLANQKGTYGTQGVAAAANIPGGRYAETTWMDASGNFWLFGGFGESLAPNQLLNDLWEYSGGEWTWMGGSTFLGQAGIYGVQGTPASGNIPGGRDSSVGWQDASGNFWLFGGYGLDSTLKQGFLNDLWEYSNGQWTWMGGSAIKNQPSSYGILGVSAPGNVPGGRSELSQWVDPYGAVWLFGGYDSIPSTTQCGCSNDVWRFLP